MSRKLKAINKKLKDKSLVKTKHQTRADQDLKDHLGTYGITPLMQARRKQCKSLDEFLEMIRVYPGYLEPLKPGQTKKFPDDPLMEI